MQHYTNKNMFTNGTALRQGFHKSAYDRAPARNSLLCWLIPAAEAKKNSLDPRLPTSGSLPMSVAASHCSNVGIKRLIASTLCQLVALSLMRINASSPWCKYKRHEDSLAHRPATAMLPSDTSLTSRCVAPPRLKLCVVKTTSLSCKCAQTKVNTLRPS